MYRQKVQIQKPTSKNNPHLFPLHHSCIRPTPSQTHRYYFLIHKNLEPPSYKQTSISRYHPTYTKKLVQRKSVSPAALLSLFDSSKSSVTTRIAPFLPQKTVTIDYLTLHQKQTPSIRIYLLGINTDAVTYSTDARRRQRSIPMLSHIWRGQTQAPHPHTHAYTPCRSQHIQKY